MAHLRTNLKTISVNLGPGKLPQSQGQHGPKIMKPPQSLPLQMAESLLRAQPDSVANPVTDRWISDRCALT